MGEVIFQDGHHQFLSSLYMHAAPLVKGWNLFSPSLVSGLWPVICFAQQIVKDMTFWDFWAQALRRMAALMSSLLEANCHLRGLTILRPPCYEKAPGDHVESPLGHQRWVKASWPFQPAQMPTEYNQMAQKNYQLSPVNSQNHEEKKPHRFWFKPLSFGVAGYTATDNWNRREFRCGFDS